MLTVNVGDRVVLDPSHPDNGYSVYADRIAAGNDELIVNDIYKGGCSDTLYAVLEHAGCGNAFDRGNYVSVARLMYPAGLASTVPATPADEIVVGDEVVPRASETAPGGKVVRIIPYLGSSRPNPQYDILYVEGAEVGYYRHRYEKVVRPTRKVRLVVTKKDILEGNLMVASACPMVRALRRALKKEYHKTARAFFHFVRVDKKDFDANKSWEREVKKKDNPKTFHRYVELPTEYLRRG